MSDQRFIIEMGMDNDLHGEDYTKAAIRAAEDALRHSCLPMFEALEIGHDRMRAQVTWAYNAPKRWMPRRWRRCCPARRRRGGRRRGRTL